MTYENKILGVSRGHREFVSKLATQLSKATVENANIQAAVTTNSDRSEANRKKIDSRISNPAKAHKNEKYEIADQVRTKLKKHLNSINVHILKDLNPALAQFALHGGVLLESITTLPAMAADAGALILKAGMAKANGWKLIRLSDALMMMAKFVSLKGEVAIQMDAPAVLTTTELHHRKSELDIEVAGVKAVICKEEIHRVAGAYGMDAGSLVLIIQGLATLYSNGHLQLASTTTAELSALGQVAIKAAGEVKSSALTHTIVDAAGGTIRIVGGIIMLNPLTRATPDLPAEETVLPVVPVIPLTPQGPVAVIPQYEGVNALGTSII